MERQPWLSLFMLAGLSPLIIGAPSSMVCPNVNLGITGGTFSLSDDGTLIKYSCPKNYYPTIPIRRCLYGRWDPMTEKKLPQCKKITCPDPQSFENGEVRPYLSRYYVNDTTRYSCYSGYEFRGSETRVCQENGKWSGSTPICGRNSDYCPDPGTPAGAARTGNSFYIDDKVTYRCENKLTLIGSKVRVCQENSQWSGTEPECYAAFTYDTPEEASESFSSSLKKNLQLSQEHEATDQYGKKIQVSIGGKLDIYIALDVSDSITEEEFEKAKEVIKTLIEKISYYEVSPNYEILVFATDVTPIVTMRDFKTGQGKSLLKILEKLDNYKYDTKGQRSGTNIAQVYKGILESMKIEQIQNIKDFEKTQHVVILFSDGQFNMGGSPKPWVEKIKSLVTQNDPSKEEKLDLYAFGMGDVVNEQDMNDFKSDRGNEKFFFKLKDLDDLKETFDNMIDEGNSVALCGLYRDYDDGTKDQKRRRYPWLAKINVPRNNEKKLVSSNCLGSLVSSTFILTAAHCFRSDDTPDRITIELDQSSSSKVKAEYFKIHSAYNVTAKKHMGISEYYEFDVALIKLQKPVIMDVGLRPICIPCTKETSGALRLSDKDGTCSKHKEMLMTGDTVKASFFSEIKSNFVRKDITIKQGNLRKACVEDSKRAAGMTAKNAADIVNDNFLCSGGIDPTTDDLACKGDSGGATFVVPGGRMVQVGIVSWGVEDLCKNNPKPHSESHTRDYHTNLFSPEVRKFLKEYLGNETLGTPLTFL